jgi:hypothetical protein
MGKELEKKKSDIIMGASAKAPASKGSAGAKAGLGGLGFAAATEKLKPAKEPALAKGAKGAKGTPEAATKKAAPAPVIEAAKAAGAGAESGTFVVSGAWDSFGQWTLTFQGGMLVDSYTDDLPSSDWPTTMTREGNEIVLTAVQQGGDATITEELRVAFEGGSLVAKAAKTTFVDLTDDSVSVKSIAVSASRG